MIVYDFMSSYAVLFKIGNSQRACHCCCCSFCAKKSLINWFLWQQSCIRLPSLCETGIFKYKYLIDIKTLLGGISWIDRSTFFLPLFLPTPLLCHCRVWHRPFQFFFAFMSAAICKLLCHGDLSFWIWWIYFWKKKKKKKHKFIWQRNKVDSIYIRLRSLQLFHSIY